MRSPISTEGGPAKAAPRTREPAERPARESRHVPGATYRIQFGALFGFSSAEEAVTYLTTLGVTDCYASPLFSARSGSTHGYDVTDPTRLNAELGSDEDFDALCDTMRRHGLGLLLDFVPNHMCIACNENRFWQDVLQNGRASKYASWFDVYWDESNRFLVPLLGRKLDEVIAEGELKLERDAEGFFLSYFEQRFPLSEEARSLVTQALAAEDGGLRNQNGSFTPDFIQRILSLLPYRLVHWRTAERRPGYRRFFTINELAGLRIEEPEVFRTVHRKAFDLISAGCVTGLRIDHVDGLRLPRKYLRDLRAACSDLVPHREPFYVVVEKILAPDEWLPADWPVDGTTGYEFLNALARWFVHSDGAEAVRRAYAEFTGHTERFPAVAHEAKEHVLSTSLRGDVERLIARIAERSAATLSHHDLRGALVSVLSSLRVYRTYWEPDRAMDAQDQRWLTEAFADARGRNHGVPSRAFDLLWAVLFDGLELDEVARREFVLRFQQLSGPAAAKGIEDTALYRYVPLTALNEVGGDPDASGMTAVEFHAFNQQRLRWPHALSATSTHDTKRGEDVRLRIVALSEIPEQWVAALDRFRRTCRLREEARVLDPVDEYLFYQTVVGALPPGDDRNLDDFASRIEHYMLKAVREADRHTSWQKPNEAYECNVVSFVQNALSNAVFLEEVRRFALPVATAGAWASISQVVLKVASPGVPDFYQGSELYELSLVDPDNRRPVDFGRRQTLLKGVLEDLRERPRDAWRSWLEPPGDERLKLAVVLRALALRRRRAEVFEQGRYVPLGVSGPRSEHLVSFARVRGEDVVIAAAGRWYLTMSAPPALPIGSVWRGTTAQAPAEVPEGTYTDAFTGNTISTHASAGSVHLPVERVFEQLPVALLERIR